MIQQSVSRTSTVHVLSTEGKVPKSVREALTYKKYLFLKYLVKFLEFILRISTFSELTKYALIIMQLIDSDISSAQLQCMNELELRWRSLKSGQILAPTTRNFKLYQHITYRDKSCHDNCNIIYFKLNIPLAGQNHSIIKKKR